MMKGGLLLHNVGLKIEGKEIFKSLNLQLHPGEIHVLLGPNGVGKSSLLKALSGHPFYKDISGDIFFEGENILSWSIEERAKKGIFVAFQSPYEIEGLTVANFLRTAIKAFPQNSAHGLSATDFYQLLYRLLDQVGLPRNFTSRALNCGFSGGEKKRLELLQLMLFQPKYALVDEIDSGLDIDARKKVIDVIKEVQKNNSTCFLIVSHDIDFIRQLNPAKIHVFQNKTLKTVDASELDRIEHEGFVGNDG